MVPSSPQGNFVTAFPSGWLEADKKTLKADHILRLDVGCRGAQGLGFRAADLGLRG